MGKVTAIRLIENGFEVVAAARRTEQMSDLKQLGATSIALDISKEESITAAVAEIEERFGGVDVLVNNAGLGLYGAVEDVPLADERPEAVGVSAIDLLITQISRNELGLPGTRRLLRVEGAWISGRTVRAQRRRQARTTPYC